MKVSIEGETRDMKAVWYDDYVYMLDQTRLPGEVSVFIAENTDDVAHAIKTMVVRGAPAIGIAAAYGMALGWRNGEEIEEAYKKLRGTRPTAKDLFHALEYMKENILSGKDAVKAADEYARDIYDSCRRIGEYGNELIKDGFRILTHCNAGALAVGEWGTATAPIYMAHMDGKKLFVWVDETRPRLQGASLTAWEMLNAGIDHAVIADNAAGFFMRKDEVDMVIVGADRIARNGDVANKIGTYEKAVLAHENGIPFYVAAPLSTFDFSIKTGDEIPIEERSEDEVLKVKECRVAPEGSPARNPAFDVTPAKYITGIITEYGVFRPDDVYKLEKRVYG